MKHHLAIRTLFAGALLLSVAGQSARAATAQGFEAGLPSGSTIGDALVQGAFEGITPPEGNSQLLLTTINNAANSDQGTVPLSNTNAAAVGGVAAFVGNNQAGVTVNTLRFDATHTGREGSAFAVTLALQVGSVVTFQYDFLTAEDPTDNPAHEDFGFATLVNSAGTLVHYQVLGHQTGATNSTAQGPFFSETGSSAGHFVTYQFTISTAGSYTLGIGVMDAQSNDTPSALLVDNISVSAVPEPATIVFFIGGAAVLGMVQRRLKKSS
jgi:hypothetical protein